jgi:hypothetical protein
MEEGWQKGGNEANMTARVVMWKDDQEKIPLRPPPFFSEDFKAAANFSLDGIDMIHHEEAIPPTTLTLRYKQKCTAAVQN